MLEITSLTIVGASENQKKYSHKALKKALENKIEVYTVNQSGKPIVIKLNNGELPSFKKTFKKISEVPRTTDYIALYISRERILRDGVGEEIVKRKYPNIIIPPQEKIETTNDYAMTERIRKFFKDNGYKDENLLIDVCYIRNL